MRSISVISNVSAPFEEVVNGFDKNLFKALLPSFPRMKVKRFDGCKKGDIVELKMGIGPMTWISEISETSSGWNYWEFVDIGVKLPFPIRKWRHCHRVEREGSNTLILDKIEFSSGWKLIDWAIAPILTVSFKKRKALYSKYFDSHEQQTPQVNLAR